MTQLISDVRIIADVESESDRHPDSEIERFLNEAISAYRDEVSCLGNPVFLTELNATTLTAGQSDYSLPSDFLRLFGVTIASASGDSWEAFPLELPERHDFDDSGDPTHYSLVPSGKIRFFPTPGGGTTYRLLYLAQWTDISGSSTFEPVLTDGDRWVVLEAAMQVATRDENSSAYQMLSDRKREIWTRIRRSAATRSSGPGRRIDTRSRRGVVRRTNVD
jgi:hypothetical protein